MHKHENNYRAVSVATLLFCLLFGIAAGYLYPKHFENVRIVFWISFGVAAAMWLISAIGNRQPSRSCRDPLDGLKWCNIALFAISVIGLAIADSRAPLHAVLFGADIALTGYLLIKSLFRPESEQIRINQINAGQDTTE